MNLVPWIIFFIIKLTIFFSVTGSQDFCFNVKINVADAKIVHRTSTAFGEGDKIIVSSEEIPNPKYVRYAWADAPINPNLINKEGLPAVPFRTDK